RKETIKLLEKAKREAASQESDNLGECHSLIDLLDGTEGEERDELRRRIKTALGRLVEGLWVLTVSRGHDRLITLQVWFKGGKVRRDYLIWYRVASYRRGGKWNVRSLADVVKARDLDLRRRADAAALERTLLALDVEALRRRLDEGTAAG